MGQAIKSNIIGALKIDTRDFQKQEKLSDEGCYLNSLAEWDKNWEKIIIWITHPTMQVVRCIIQKRYLLLINLAHYFK